MRILAIFTALFLALAAPKAAVALSASTDRLEAYWAREALRTLCMEHRLDPDGTLRTAEASGWLPLSPADVSGGVMDKLHLTGVSARWKASPKGEKAILVLGDGGDAGPGCAIVFRGSFAAATSVIGGHFMLPIRRFEEPSPTHHLWAFVEEKGKRRRGVKSYFGKIDHALIASARATRTFSTIDVIGYPETGSAAFLYSAPSAP